MEIKQTTHTDNKPTIYFNKQPVGVKHPELNIKTAEISVPKKDPIPQGHL